MRHRLARVAFVEHSGQEHDAVHAELFHVARVAAGLGGAGFGHAAQNGDAAGHGLEHLRDKLALFVAAQGLIFAKRAEKDEAGDAGFDENFRMRRRRVEVNGLVSFELGGDGGENAAPEWFAHVDWF